MKLYKHQQELCDRAPDKWLLELDFKFYPMYNTTIIINCFYGM